METPDEARLAPISGNVIRVKNCGPGSGFQFGIIISAALPRTHKFWASLATSRATAKTSQNEYELSNQSHSRSGDASGTFKPRLNKKSKQTFEPVSATNLKTQIYSNNMRARDSDDDKGRSMGYYMDDETSQSSLKGREYGVLRTTEIKQTQSPNPGAKYSGRWNNAK
ncbi:MAG: hypothetical protein Q9227_002305 [Pyrenula ochraceoflavens]